MNLIVDLGYEILHDEEYVETQCVLGDGRATSFFKKGLDTKDADEFDLDPTSPLVPGTGSVSLVTVTLELHHGSFS